MTAVALNRPAVVLVATLALSVAAQAQQSRGVNPADIDSRADVIYKHISLEPAGSTDVLTFKYDYKVNNVVGLNFELPAYSKLKVPGFSASGNGDLFARARYIVPLSREWIVGGSFETVLPVASKDELGTGKYQINVGALAVRLWSKEFISAFVFKQTTSVGGESNRAKFSNSEVRFVPVYMLTDGWAISGELRQVWEHRGEQARWQLAEAVLNKQFNQNWAGSMSYSRQFGDRKDRGAVGAAVKYFF